MALAVFFLLLGTLAAEVALFGLYQAALVGAVLMALCALTLAVLHHRMKGESMRDGARRAAPKVARAAAH